MNRVVFILLVLIGGLLALASLSLVFLFQSGPGRGLIAGQAQSAIASATGGGAEIGKLRGALPGLIIVEDLTLTDDEGVWAKIDRLEMRWRPLALVGGDIDIDRLIVDGGAIYRAPPEKPAPADEEPEPFTIDLPRELPSVAIDELEINDFVSELEGVSARLDGGGVLSMGGRQIDMRVNLTSANNADTIDLAANIAPGAERIFIDATIAATEEGVIAAFADLGGPLFIEIKSDSPADAAEITLDGVIGGYGEIDATILADLSDAVEARLRGAFTPGDRLSDIPELSAPVDFDMTIADRENGGALTVASINAAPLALDGIVEWRDLRETTAENSLTADLQARLAEDYRPEIQAYTGRTLDINAGLTRRPDDYLVTADVSGERIAIALTETVTDLRQSAEGRAEISIEVLDNGLPPAPTRLRTRFDIDLDASASLRELVLEIEDNLKASGVADYDFTSEQIRFDGDIVAQPRFVTAYAPSIEPQGALNATVLVSGAPDRFTLETEADIPAARMGENSSPPILANINLAGLPSSPSGEIAARARSGAGSFNATLRSSADGRIAAPVLNYQGQDFLLDGSGAYNPQAQRGEIDLTYEGGEEAQPWPGLSLSGDLSAKGSFAKDGAQTDFTLAAKRLAAAGFAVEGLNAIATGPASAIETQLSADYIGMPDGRSVNDFSAAATVNTQDDIVIRLTDLGATVLDNLLSLKEPATVTLAEGVTIDNLRLGWSRSGAIALDARIQPERWRATLAASEINIPDSDGRITLSADLDTNNDILATGDFTVRSLIAGEEEEASISGDLRWTADALTLQSRPGDDGLDMLLELPVGLDRQPALSVTTDGELDGYIRYDGAVEPFAAFLPPDMQTLEGDLAVDFNLGGTTKLPEIAGNAMLSDGAYTELRSGLSIAGISTRADARYGPDGTRVTFSGGGRGADQSGEDTITISGDMALGETSRIDVAVNMSDAVLSAHPVSEVRADGEITIAGPLNAIEINGDIIVNELDAQVVTPESTGLVPIEVVNIEDAQEANEGGAEIESTLAYDISITADDRIFVRGRGLESEWSANVRAQSDNGEPLILGAINLRRGSLDFAGRRFDLTQGNIRFDRLSKNNPTLDIRAEFETDNNITAALVISGRAQEPSIELTSTPSRPSEDIMSLVLFGKPASELTAFESLQTAQALAALGGVGPFGGGGGGLTGSLRQAVGLDLLNIDVDPESGGGSLTVGKYVAEGLFVSAKQNAQGKGGAVMVEYEITDNISVETELRQDGDQTVSANWKKDF